MNAKVGPIETYAKMDTATSYVIQQYPHICDVASRMAYDNGCVNRQELIENFYETCDTVLADKDTSDLRRLDEWLGTLTQEQKDTLADGEDIEILTLVNAGPDGGPDSTPLANLFDDIFEVM